MDNSDVPILIRDADRDKKRDAESRCRCEWMDVRSGKKLVSGLQHHGIIVNHKNALRELSVVGSDQALGPGR